ncbi:hypothetical protein DRO97_07560 [Archaeoglobales archaeon]|nr:MAG: hypothetical protein DRO97_07560 [Archaeoglobales archaeon]
MVDKVFFKVCEGCVRKPCTIALHWWMSGVRQLDHCDFKLTAGVYSSVKELYNELAEIEFDLLNLVEESKNEKLKLITNNLTNILNRMSATFEISEKVDHDV